MNNNLTQEQIDFWLRGKPTEDWVSLVNQNKVSKFLIPLEKLTLKQMREIGYPWHEYNKNRFDELFNKLRNIDLNKMEEVSKNKTIVNRKNSIFTILASTFFPHMLSTQVKGMRTPMEVFLDDETMIKVFSKMFGGGISKSILNGTVLYKDIKPITKIFSGTQCVSNFRPSVAKYFYDKFCPQNGKIFDFSMGYGGRLVGFLASNASQYVGTDVNSLNYEGYDKILKAFNKEERTLFGSARKKVTVFKCPMEEFDVLQKDLKLYYEDGKYKKTDVIKYKNYFDLVFSSPPYFNKELYSDDKEQSCNRYTEFDAWVHGFLKPTIKNIYNILDKKGHFIINIANVATLKSKNEQNIQQHTKDFAKDIGFILSETRYMELASMPGKSLKTKKNNVRKFEPVFIFQKP